MGSIIGKVINQQDGQPIDGADIKASEGSLEREVQTGADGAFDVDSLNEGKYDLAVTKAGFDQGLYGPIAVFDDEPTKLLLALQPSSDG